MRLYIDLLFRKTNMYANYNPATLLELGDYGDITKGGEFIRSGNILQDDPSLRDAVEVGKEPTGSDKHFFTSRSPRNNTFSVITTDIPTLAECSPKLGWDIKKDRHAALIMIDANRHEIKFEGRLHRYIQNLPELADKAVVTKVYRCSAYAQLITNEGQSGQVYAGFKGNNSAPSTPNSSAASVVDRTWQTYSQTGNWNTGTHPLSSSLYTPLVTIRQIRPKGPTSGYRDPIPPEITDEDEMQDYILPWGDLDEHGDEID
jgi:hypothetical protein